MRARSYCTDRWLAWPLPRVMRARRGGGPYVNRAADGNGAQRLYAAESRSLNSEIVIDRTESILAYLYGGVALKFLRRFVPLKGVAAL